MFDETDIKVLKENFEEETIKQINEDNLIKIYNYLINDGIYFAKDLFISSLDLFLLPPNIFIEKFEHLKTKLGFNYIDKLASDISLIEIMYED